MKINEKSSHHNRKTFKDLARSQHSMSQDLVMKTERKLDTDISRMNQAFQRQSIKDLHPKLLHELSDPNALVPAYVRF